MDEKELRSRRKIFRFTQYWFFDFLTQCSELPEDAKLKGMSFDFDTGDLKVQVVHESFDKVDEGCASTSEWLEFKDFIPKDSRY